MAEPTADAINVLAFAGSLRKDSYNRRLIRAAQELAPAGMTIEITDLAPLPFYNFDVEQQGDPAPVAEFKQAIAAADGLLIATPEYNYGVTGVLKNAVDWASRPPRKSSLNGKPVAVMGATPGMTGTARAQLQLRQALTFTNSYAMPQPELLVFRAQDKFDGDGRLADQTTRDLLAALLEAFRHWVLTFRR